MKKIQMRARMEVLEVLEEQPGSDSASPFCIAVCRWEVSLNNAI
jgi:hypothetical protein